MLYRGGKWKIEEYKLKNVFSQEEIVELQVSVEMELEKDKKEGRKKHVIEECRVPGMKLKMGDMYVRPDHALDI